MNSCRLVDMTLNELKNEYALADGNPVKQRVILQFIKIHNMRIQKKQKELKHKQELKRIQELKMRDDIKKINDDISYDSISDSDSGSEHDSDSFDLWDGYTDNESVASNDSYGMRGESDVLREEENTVLTQDKINDQLNSRLSSDINIKKNQKRMDFYNRPMAGIYDDSF